MYKTRYNPINRKSDWSLEYPFGTQSYESAAEYKAATGVISVNLNHNSILNGNYYDTYLILIHEHNHSMTPNDAGTFTSEYEAYQAMKPIKL